MHETQMKAALLILQKLLLNDPPQIDLSIATINLWLDSHWPNWTVEHFQAELDDTKSP